PLCPRSTISGASYPSFSRSRSVMTRSLRARGRPLEVSSPRLRSAAVATELCPACGADLDTGAAACVECGRATGSTFARPTMTEAEEAVEYDLDEVDAAERARTTDALAAAAVPYRWEDGLVLAVPEADEQRVDAIFDTLSP